MANGSTLPAVEVTIKTEVPNKPPISEDIKVPCGDTDPSIVAGEIVEAVEKIKAKYEHS